MATINNSRITATTTRYSTTDGEQTDNNNNKIITFAADGASAISTALKKSLFECSCSDLL